MLVSHIFKLKAIYFSPKRQNYKLSEPAQDYFNGALPLFDLNHTYYFLLAFFFFFASSISLEKIMKMECVI